MVINKLLFDQKKVRVVTISSTADYIASLPEIDTARLPLGALFFAEGRLYQVIEAANGGFHKAREWRHTEATDVALIPGSFPARHLPLVKRGRLLPVYRSRQELTDHERPSCFVFPTETLALDAAYLDVALIQSPGAYVRQQETEPAFAVTDGVRIFRLYYFRETAHGRPADLSSLQARPLAFEPRAHTDGPGYWRLLPSWVEQTRLRLDITQPINLRKALDEDTLPNIPLDSSQEP